MLLFLLLWWRVVEHLRHQAVHRAVARRGGAGAVDRFGMLMDNLAPTAIEAICGFLLGNLAAISLATVFV